MRARASRTKLLYISLQYLFFKHLILYLRICILGRQNIISWELVKNQFCCIKNVLSVRINGKSMLKFIFIFTYNDPNKALSSLKEIISMLLNFLKEEKSLFQ